MTIGKTDRVVSALQPTWLIGLGRARTRDQPVSKRKGYPDRFRGSPPRSSVDAMPDLIVLSLPCQVVGNVTPTPCAPPSKGRPLAPAEAYPAARGVRRQGEDNSSDGGVWGSKSTGPLLLRQRSTRKATARRYSSRDDRGEVRKPRACSLHHSVRAQDSRARRLTNEQTVSRCFGAGHLCKRGA